MEKLVQRLVQDELMFRKKLAVLGYARDCGRNAKAWRDFEVPKSTFYLWKKAYTKEGEAGLRRKKPVAHTHPKQIQPQIIEKVLHIRESYQLGPERIMWYLERYHGIRISQSSVYRILARHGLNRLPDSVTRRAIHTKRYAKTVPGHHIQVDVKFLMLEDDEGNRVRRFQYTAIDDATRVRALQIYRKHNQRCAIQFIDYVIEKFPFRINTIRTDRGHEFQAQVHWHVEDQGMKHVYIKPRSPQLNGKVERSHRTDQEEFYQLLTYTDDVDLNRKLEAWEQFYNLSRPHAAHDGQTPYEVLRSLLI